MVAPEKFNVVLPAPGAQVGGPPQVVDALGVAATCSPAGKLSLNEAPVNATLFSLVIVKVNVEVALTAIGSGEKTLVNVS